MNKLEEIYFKDFVKLKRGYDLPNDKIVDGKYPVVASTSIKAFHKEYKVLPPSVVTGRSGSLGEVQFIDTPCWPLNTALYVKNFNKNNPKYVYYFLRMIHLENFNSGAGVPTLNPNHLHKLKIKIHSKEEQQQIAAILTAYDDLIETNNQRIATLEQLAQQIYKEWFVRMRFPGWENTQLHHGIPDGWEVKKVKDAFNIVGGGTPSKDTGAYWVEGTINWFTPTNLTNSNRILINESSLKCNETGYKESSARMFPAYSVMMTSRATIGAVAINTTEACTNQGFITCIPNEKFSYPFLFYWIKQNREFFMLMASGATFLEITKGTFNKIDILVPPEFIMNRFTDMACPLFKQIEILQEQIDILTKTRNLLLPRLISGKLSLKQAEATLNL